MNTDVSEVRSTLNDLIETCKDGDQGFRTAAEKLQNSETKSKFLEFARQRATFAGELQAEVTRLGGDPETSGSTSAALHRGWIDLKSALTGNSDHSILEEAERGEDVAVKAYRDALGKGLPSDLEMIVSRQLKEVQQAHNTVKMLRDSGQTLAGRS